MKDWNVMVKSLMSYRNITENNDYIPSSFVIPSTLTFPVQLHGIQLGRLLEEARQAYRKHQLTTLQINTLEESHMHWESESYKLKCISLPALDMYKTIYKDLRVPVEHPRFIIPSKDPWPENLWGVKLGSQVSDWRRHKDTLPLHVVQALNERDFIWNVDEEDFHAIILPALKTYTELKGDLLVPRSFQVPATAAWPKSTHGYQLGLTVAYVRRHKGIDKAKDDILDAMIFIWDPIRYQFEKVMLPACKIYVNQPSGDLNTVGRGFKIPKTILYPTECHGYSLGEKLHQWRLAGARPDLLEEIKALGFKPDPISFSQRDLSTLLVGMKWFQTTFGHKERVKTSRKTATCLPNDHPTWPGLLLGELFHRAKTWDETIGFSDADRKKLKVFATWNSVYQSTIFPLMEMYYLLNGNLQVLRSFAVPSYSPWPTWSWQQKLGTQTDKIRGGSLSLSEKEKNVLDSMDFKWGPKGRTPQRESKRHKSN